MFIIITLGPSLEVRTGEFAHGKTARTEPTIIPMVHAICWTIITML